MMQMKINGTTLTHLLILKYSSSIRSIVFRLSSLIGVTTKKPEGRGDGGGLIQKIDIVDGGLVQSSTVLFQRSGLRRREQCKRTIVDFLFSSFSFRSRL